MKRASNIDFDALAVAVILSVFAFGSLADRVVEPFRDVVVQRQILSKLERKPLLFPISLRSDCSRPVMRTERF